MPIQILTPNSLSINADIDELDAARSRFSHFLGQFTLSHEGLMAWELAFTEVVSNAIVHGSDLKRGDFVKVDWLQYGRSIKLSVSDSGNGPSAAIIENPSLPDDLLASSGRGIFLINSFADQWLHVKSNLGYTQCIVKHHAIDLPSSYVA